MKKLEQTSLDQTRKLEESKKHAEERKKQLFEETLAKRADEKAEREFLGQIQDQEIKKLMKQ